MLANVYFTIFKVHKKKKQKSIYQMLSLGKSICFIFASYVFFFFPIVNINYFVINLFLINIFQLSLKEANHPFEVSTSIPLIQP